MDYSTYLINILCLRQYDNQRFKREKDITSSIGMAKAAFSELAGTGLVCFCDQQPRRLLYYSLWLSHSQRLCSNPTTDPSHDMGPGFPAFPVPHPRDYTPKAYIAVQWLFTVRVLVRNESVFRVDHSISRHIVTGTFGNLALKHRLYYCVWAYICDVDKTEWLQIDEI